MILYNYKKDEKQIAAYLQMQQELSLVLQLSREPKHVCIITSTYNSTLFKSVVCYKLENRFLHISKTFQHSFLVYYFQAPSYLWGKTNQEAISWPSQSLQAHTPPCTPTFLSKHSLYFMSSI